MSAATVRKYLPKRERGPPSQTWRAFRRNHTNQLIAVDFFMVPAVTFRVLFVLSHWPTSAGGCPPDTPLDHVCPAAFLGYRLRVSFEIATTATAQLTHD